MIAVSIIIKTLNEERHVLKAITSAKNALRGMSGEIILADSLSTDKTIAIAKKQHIKIVQLTNPLDRSCGVGPQLGYLESKGKFVYILDGDMELNASFIKKGVLYLAKNPDVAGVGGIIEEQTTSNLVFKRRKQSSFTTTKNITSVPSLMMGGLYRRSAIASVGYFSNPHLHAYEESDLGHRLTTKGFELHRLPIPMIIHKGHITSSLTILTRRWRSRYLWGPGELLKFHLFKRSLPPVVWELKIYLALILWWLGLGSALLLDNDIAAKSLLALALIVTVIMIIKKHSLRNGLFSLVSWHLTAIGLICGFIAAPFSVTSTVSRKVVR